MSLEDALRENTEALKANTAALLGKATTPAPKAVPKKAEAEGAEAAPAAGKKGGAKKPAVTYPQLQELVVKLAKLDRETAVQILADFGVEIATELDPSQYAEAYELFDKAIKAAGGDKPASEGNLA